MFTLLIKRLAVLLLIPCLAMDPVVARALSAPRPSFAPVDGLSPSRFLQEALAGRIFSSHRQPPIPAACAAERAAGDEVLNRVQKDLSPLPAADPLEKQWLQLRRQFQEHSKPLTLIAIDRDGSLTTQIWEDHRESDNQPIATSMSAMLQTVAEKSPRTQLAILTGGYFGFTDKYVTSHLLPRVRERLWLLGGLCGMGRRPKVDLKSPDDLFVNVPISKELREVVKDAFGEVIRENHDALHQAGFHGIVPNFFDRPTHLFANRDENTTSEGIALLGSLIRDHFQKSDELKALKVSWSAIAVDIALTDKEDGMKALADALVSGGLAPDRKSILKQSLVVGDSENDLPMLNLVAESGGIAIWIGGVPSSGAIFHKNIIQLIGQGPVGAEKAFGMYLEILEQSQVEIQEGSGDTGHFDSIISEIRARAADRRIAIPSGATILLHVAGQMAGTITDWILNEALRILGKGSDYVSISFELPPGREGMFAEVMECIRAGVSIGEATLSGIIVSKPFKSRVLSIPNVNVGDAAVGMEREVGLVLKTSDGLAAYLTDGQAWADSVRPRLGETGEPSFQGKVITCLGAGAVGTSITGFLARTEPPSEIILSDVGHDKADLLAAQLRKYGHGIKVTVVDPESDKLYDSISRSDIVVNASGIGKTPKPDASPLQREEFDVREGTLFVDVEFRPQETLFLKRAQGNADRLHVNVLRENGAGFMYANNAAHLRQWLKEHGVIVPFELLYEIVAKVAQPYGAQVLPRSAAAHPALDTSA